MLAYSGTLRADLKTWSKCWCWKINILPPSSQSLDHARILNECQDQGGTLMRCRISVLSQCCPKDCQLVAKKTDSN